MTYSEHELEFTFANEVKVNYADHTETIAGAMNLEVKLHSEDKVTKWLINIQVSGQCL